MGLRVKTRAVSSPVFLEILSDFGFDQERRILNYGSI